MRLALTVVEPILAASVDLVLDADPRLSVAALARELARAVRPESRLPARPSRSRATARVPSQRLDAATDGGFVPFGPAATSADPSAPDGGAIMLRFPDLQGRNGSPFTGPRLYVDGQLVDPTLSLAESIIRDGSLVSLDSPAGCLPAEPPGITEVRVVGGPGAGVVHRLGPGEFEIGRDAWCAV
ncbi:MAG: FtsK/SpoIIIE domain-containing protein, partial [Frankia sp.]